MVNTADVVIFQIYLIIGSVSLIMSMLVIFCTVFMKELRKPPGWLIFW
jgi:hypothetical protein